VDPYANVGSAGKKSPGIVDDRGKDQPKDKRRAQKLGVKERKEAGKPCTTP
jgi:hypothetical protein